MVYKFRVWLSENEDQEKGFLVEEDWMSAMKRLNDFYGDEIYRLEMEEINDCGIVFAPKGEDVFNEMAKANEY